MPDEPWLEPLDRIRSATNEIDQTLVHIPPESLAEIVGVLRGVNRHIWRIIDTLEAGRVKYLYDVASLLRACADEHLDMTDNWLELVANDVFTIKHKELLRLANKKGIDVADYLEEPKGHTDETLDNATD